LIGIIREQQAAALHPVNDFARNGFAERGASPAAAEAPLRAGKRLADVRRAVHHDRALTRPIVEALVEAVEPQ
jgi:hypothetical protein